MYKNGSSIALGYEDEYKVVQIRGLHDRFDNGVQGHELGVKVVSYGK